MKVFQMRGKIKVKTIENQRVSDLSKTRHRNEKIQMRLKKIVKTKEVNVSRICPKSVTEMKTFQMRKKIKVKTIENRRVSITIHEPHRTSKILLVRLIANSNAL